MSEFDVPKRVHVVPLGYESDRIVRPVVDGDADEVLFLEPDADREGVDRPAYHDTVRERIRAEGISTETVVCDIFDLFSSLGTIAEISDRFRDHNVYVNLASGSKVTAIGWDDSLYGHGSHPVLRSCEGVRGRRGPAGGLRGEAAGDAAEVPDRRAGGPTRRRPRVRRAGTARHKRRPH